MRKAFMGVRLQRLREERGLTQMALAHIIGISPSYLNQLERNQRPLTVSILLRISGAFGIDPQVFSEDDEARLAADLREVLSDSAGNEKISTAEIKELASNMPAVGRVLVALHRRNQALLDRLDTLASGTELPVWANSPLPPPMPYEEVLDFFYRHHNHFAPLDLAAEKLFNEATLSIANMDRGLEQRLERRHGIRTILSADTGSGRVVRRFDEKNRLLTLSHILTPTQRAFQMAAQLAFLDEAATLASLVEEARFSSTQAQALARIGLANYFAGAVILPYGPFLDNAERLNYDIELLEERFGAGFETICHRLSTLQRPGSPGVPFFFVRVDRAGNMSKRQSATSFHFSRFGGTCPLWNVYEAFSTPGRILTQLAQMPDGRIYLWIARTLSHRRHGYGSPSKSFAVGLGCDAHHATRLVYSKGLTLNDPGAATPIGGGCKVCERPACPQRAFPPIGRPLAVDENLSRFEPYSVT